MANGGQGAVWLQLEPAVRNPYFGAEMLECGTIRAAHPGRPVQGAGAGAGDEKGR
jgi:hypothetical protein